MKSEERKGMEDCSENEDEESNNDFVSKFKELTVSVKEGESHHERPYSHRYSIPSDVAIRSLHIDRDTTADTEFRSRSKTTHPFELESYPSFEMLAVGSTSYYPPVPPSTPNPAKKLGTYLEEMQYEIKILGHRRFLLLIRYLTLGLPVATNHYHHRSDFRQQIEAPENSIASVNMSVNSSISDLSSISKVVKFEIELYLDIPYMHQHFKKKVAYLSPKTPKSPSRSKSSKRDVSAEEPGELKNGSAISGNQKFKDRKSSHPFGNNSNRKHRKKNFWIWDGFAIKDGLLKKRSPGMLKQWQQRFFYLKNDKLYYFKEISKVIDHDRDVNRFKILVKKRVYDIKAETRSSKELTRPVEIRWQQNTTWNPDGPDGRPSSASEMKRSLLSISWRNYLKVAKTGDLFLFETASIRGSLIRTATLSRYDHVAVALKFGSSKSKDQPISIGVLEATGNMVHYYRSSAFTFKLGIESLYEIINVILAHVDSDIGSKFSQFVKAAMGKDDDQRTYMCSELAAKSYKVMGLLRSDVPSSTYLPGSFQDSSGLIFLAGARLDPE
eukprot:jgi/Bigna1/129828/aug1.10_g4536